MILAGGGVHISEAWDVLQKFAESYGIPVAHTMSGKGAIACSHSHSAGLFGRYDRISPMHSSRLPIACSSSAANSAKSRPSASR